MSDWEEDHDDDGVALQNPSRRSSGTERRFRIGDRFGAQRDDKTGLSCDITKSKSRRSGGQGPSFTRVRGPGGGEKLDSAPPLTFAVENTSIGRIIGKLLFKYFHS